MHAALLMILATVVPMTAGATGGGPASLSLMPVPAVVEVHDGALEIEESFSMALAGEGATPRLERAAGRFLRRLSDRSTVFFEPAAFLKMEPREGVQLTVRAGREGRLEVGEDESYRLEAGADGISIEAATDIGAMHGLETLLQLVELDERGVVVPFVTIEDAPRFAWRGLMIDSSRHFMPVAMVLRNLDGMAAVKMNVLHWHLADDQGFRVEVRSLPGLHERGSDGRYYSQEQIREVIDFAADRGIRVVPELDLPGHATAMLAAYPELASAPGPYQIERGWGVFDPTINPIAEETYTFLETLLDEMARLFDDEFIHIGGDENNGRQWLANPEIVAFMDEHGYETPLELQRYFNERLLEILTRHGKRMIGWDEIFQEGLPTSIVIQSWRGREALNQAARLGYSGLLSNGYYIDLIQPTESHYLNDPLPEGSDLSEEAAARILGGEATMWAEYVSPETVDSRIWPRTAAIAERLWSPAWVRDVADMYRRLDRISLRLEELGLEHERNRPVMLRRLCQCRDIGPLEVLLGAIEPVKRYNRGRLRKHTQRAPLTRMVDAAWPDAAPARQLRWKVEHLLEDKTENQTEDQAERDAIRRQLETWRDNDAALQEIFRTSPALAEIVPMSTALAEVSTIGLEALELLGGPDQAAEPWLRQRLERLEAASASHGQTELMIVEPVRALVCAAAGLAAAQAEGCQAR